MPRRRGESFPILEAVARESVGRHLPNATPQSTAWRSHLARKTLTLGAASLKGRCYDATTAVLSLNKTPVLRSYITTHFLADRGRVMVVTSFIERQ